MSTIFLDLLLTLLCVLGLLLVFSVVCIICDRHLVPCVEVFIEIYKIPEEIAAVTLVAFGSACPELLLNTIGVIEGSSDLSLPAVLGSAMIAFGFIPSMCLLCNEPQAQVLEVWPILRESSFYILGLGLFVNSINDGVITLSEALILTSVYFFYVFMVIMLRYLNPTSSPDEDTYDLVGTDTPLESQDDLNNILEYDVEKRLPEISTKVNNQKDETMLGDSILDKEISMSHTIRSSHDTSSKRITTNNCSNNDDKYLLGNTVYSNTNTSRPQSPTFDRLTLLVRYQLILWNILQGIWTFVSMKIQWFLSYIIPPLFVKSTSNNIDSVIDTFDTMDSQDKTGIHTISIEYNISEDTSLCRSIVILSLCIAYVGGSAYMIVNICMYVVSILGIDSSTVGATLVALGSEIPDCINAIMLARHGYYDGAMASAIGSQVINLSLGVGFSSLLAFFLEPDLSLYNSNDVQSYIQNSTTLSTTTTSRSRRMMRYMSRQISSEQDDTISSSTATSIISGGGSGSGSGSGSEVPVSGTTVVLPVPGGLDIDNESKESLWLLVSVLLLVILSFLSAIISWSSLFTSCHLKKQVTITKSTARILLVTWSLLYLTFILKNEHVS